MRVRCGAAAFMVSPGPVSFKMGRYMLRIACVGLLALANGISARAAETSGAVLIVAVFCLGHWLWNWRYYLVWFHLLLGAAYAFHVTLNWHILQQSQTDISDQGYLFSTVIIFLGNVTVLLVGIPMLASKVEVLAALGWWLECTTEACRQITRVF